MAKKRQVSAMQMEFSFEVLPENVPALAELRKELRAWGKRLGYPAFSFDGGSLGRGEYSWRYTIQERGNVAWFEAALSHLEMNKIDPPSPIYIGDTAFYTEIRRNRGDMLLMYAGKKAYPILQVQVGDLAYTFEAGKDAWVKAAYTCELEVCETAITELAEVKYRAEDVLAMEVWLREWGKRNNYPSFGFPFQSGSTDRRWGAINYGAASWEQETHYPYGKFGSYENYPGEWLERCIEQCKRFDVREQSIPDQITRAQDEKKDAGHQEEE